MAARSKKFTWHTLAPSANDPAAPFLSPTTSTEAQIEAAKAAAANTVSTVATASEQDIAAAMAAAQKLKVQSKHPAPKCKWANQFVPNAATQKKTTETHAQTTDAWGLFGSPIHTGSANIQHVQAWVHAVAVTQLSTGYPCMSRLPSPRKCPQKETSVEATRSPLPSLDDASNLCPQKETSVEATRSPLPSLDDAILPMSNLCDEALGMIMDGGEMMEGDVLEAIDANEAFDLSEALDMLDESADNKSVGDETGSTGTWDRGLSIPPSPRGGSTHLDEKVSGGWRSRSRSHSPEPFREPMPSLRSQWQTGHYPGDGLKNFNDFLLNGLCTQRKP